MIYTSLNPLSLCANPQRPKTSNPLDALDRPRHMQNVIPTLPPRIPKCIRYQPRPFTVGIPQDVHSRCKKYNKHNLSSQRIKKVNRFGPLIYDLHTKHYFMIVKWKLLLLCTNVAVICPMSPCINIQQTTQRYSLTRVTTRHKVSQPALCNDILQMKNDMYFLLNAAFICVLISWIGRHLTAISWQMYLYALYAIRWQRHNHRQNTENGSP